MLNLAIHTFLVYKNCIQSKLLCSVLQHFNGSSKHSQNSSWVPPDCLGGVSGVPCIDRHPDTNWRCWEVLVTARSLEVVTDISCSHSLLVKWNEKQELQNTQWLPLNVFAKNCYSISQTMPFHITVLSPSVDFQVLFGRLPFLSTEYF